MMGTLKGRVGDAVYYRKQGEQNVVAYNSQVGNPQTNKQCYQRARFAAAGKFYTHGTQALFKFAFETKKKNESDFNAFMRENIDNAWPISKSASVNPTYPIVNNWLMTKGSLIPFDSQSSAQESYALIPKAVDGTPTITTIADLANAVCDGVGIINGDIVTMVRIFAKPGMGTYPAMVVGTDATFTNNWSIKQIALNKADNSTLASQGLSAQVQGNFVKVTYFTSSSSSIIDTAGYFGACAIHSRNSKAGLKVSTQRLVVTCDTDFYMPVDRIKNYCELNSYLEVIIPSWRGEEVTQVQSEVILEGSLVSRSDYATSGANPIEGCANADDASPSNSLVIPSDIRGGYILATLGSLTADDAIADAQNGNFKKWVYNNVLGAFVQESTSDFEGDGTSFKVKKLQNDGYILWREDGNGLFSYVNSYVDESGSVFTLGDM